MKAERFLIVFLLIAAVVVASFFMSPIYAALLIPVATFGVILLGNPRVFLYVYLVLLSINPILMENIAGPASYLNEVLGALLFAQFIGHLSFRKLDTSRVKKWSSVAFLFVGYVVFTWIVNRGPIKVAIQCVFNYLNFIPFYILCVNYLKRDDFYLLLKGGLFFFWLNFILNIGWFLRINPLSNYHLSINNMVDVAKGVMGGCNHVAYFCVMLFFLLVSVLQSNLLAGRKALRVWIIITLPVLLFQLFLTYTNHAYLFFALAFIPYAAVMGFWKKWQSIFAVVLVVVAIAVAFTFSEQVQFHFSKEQMLYRYDKLAYSAKVQIFNDLVVENFRTNPMEWTVGVGPGNGMGVLGKSAQTPFALKMLLDYYQAFDIRAMQMTSVTGIAASSVLTLWGDFGIIGLIIYSMLYISLYTKCHKVASGDDSAQKTVIAQSLTGAMVMLALINIVLDLLHIAGLTMWVWAWLAMFTLSKNEAPMETAGVSVGQKSEVGSRRTEDRRCGVWE